MKLHSLIAAAMLCLASSSQAALIHQFNLNGSLKDSLSTTSLTAIGGSFVDNQYVFEANKGLKLDTQLGDVYTIDMSFNFGALGGYGRILDFANRSEESGLYTMGSSFRLYDYGPTGGSLTPSVNSRMTVTRDEQKRFSVYQDGALVLSLIDDKGIADFGSNPVHFFLDNTGSGWVNEAHPGAVDYIRVFSTALTQAEVQSLETPPAVDVPEPGSLGLLGAGLALVGLTRRRKPQATA